MSASGSYTDGGRAPGEDEWFAAPEENAPADASLQPAFDRLVRLAARLFAVPAAAVTLVGAERRRVVSAVGMEEADRDASLCSRAIEAPGRVTVFEDLHAEERFEGHPRIHDGPQFRFYAGAPLVTAGGHALGAFCLLDRTPRRFAADDRAHLRDFAALAVEEFEKRRAEAAQRASEARYQRLLDHLPVGVYRSTPDGRLLEANAAMANLLGYESAAALLEERTQDLYVDAADRDRHHRRLDRERTAPGEHALRRADGEVVWVRDYPRAVTEGAGDSVDYFDGVLVDVTASRRATEALRASERQYRQLFERANVPVMIFRPGDEEILAANAEACRTYGFERDALVGARLVEHTADVERGRAEVRRILEEGGMRNYETVHYRKDGTPIHLLASASAIEYRGEEAILYFAQDVTERRRAEGENEAWRAFYENTLDNIPLEVGVLDAERRFLYLNKAAVPDAATRRAAIGQTAPECARRLGLDEEAAREHYEWFGQVIAAKEEQRREEVVTTDDGKRRYYRRIATPILDGDGAVSYVIGCRIDLTEQKEAEQQLVEAKEEAEEMARLKSTFLANMSHEIRTPLASILGFAEVLAEEVQGEQREFARLIQQGGERLSETLDSVLDLARLEAGGFEPSFEPVSVEDVLQEAADLYSPMAEDKGLEFALFMPRGDDPRLRADRAGVGRILSNLLSNAVKFTEEGSITLSGRRAGDGRVELCVADTGAGMSEDFREHLFEAFRQESSGLARLHDGTGLGLAITRHLVDVMDAEIHVESEQGVGSTFTIRFREWEDGEGNASEEARPEDASSAEVSGRKRLLVVEDNNDTRHLLQRVLEEAWAPTLASTPQEAVAAATETIFDAVLLDIHLGTEMDGVGLLKRLRQDERYAKVPFVALTAYAMPGDEEHIAASGFDAYLAKPFARAELLRVLREAAAEPAAA